MKHFLIFAGTTEGRELTEFFATQKDILVTVCTATEYGGELMPLHPSVTVISKRLDEEEMVDLMKEKHFDRVYDATHPYAVIVSQNVKAAAKKVGLTYHRIVRPVQEFESMENVVFVSSMKEAVAYLKTTNGNILCTTGSKELAALCGIPDYRERVFARIIPNPEMVAHCYELGFQGKHLICMQGPFSEELNVALIHQFGIKYLLTKDSGKAGGFLEKVESAEKTGTKLVIIGRPVEEEGEKLEDVIKNYSQA